MTRAASLAAAPPGAVIAAGCPRSPRRGAAPAHRRARGRSRWRTRLPAGARRRGRSRPGPEGGLQVRARGQRRGARAVRAGHRQRARPREDRRRERVRRHADARSWRDRPRGPTSDSPRPRQHDRERARPAGRRQGRGPIVHLRETLGVGDERTRTGRATSRDRTFASNSRSVAPSTPGDGADAVHRVGREHDQFPPTRGGSRIGDGVGLHGRLATTKRSRPVRSCTTRASVRPAALTTRDTSSPCVSPISSASVPPGRNHAIASAHRRSTSSMPPTSAVSGSASTSAGNERDLLRPHVGRIAHDHVHATPERSGKRRQQVPQEHLDRKPERRGVLPRERHGGAGVIDGEHPGVPALVGDGERDGARPRADVDDHRRGEVVGSHRGRARRGARSPGVG